MADHRGQDEHGPWGGMAGPVAAGSIARAVRYGSRRNRRIALVLTAAALALPIAALLGALLT